MVQLLKDLERACEGLAHGKGSLTPNQLNYFVPYCQLHLQKLLKGAVYRNKYIFLHPAEI